MKHLHRMPTVENKYSLDLKMIKKLKIIDRNNLKDFGFWKNNVISGWCYSEELGDGPSCPDNSFWLCIYDENIDISRIYGRKKDMKKALKKANTVDFYFGIYECHCEYVFNSFYKPKDIENEYDLLIQELFLKKINELIDANILEIV